MTLLVHLCFLMLATALTIKSIGADNQTMRTGNLRELHPIDRDRDRDRNGEDDTITGLKTYIINGNDSSLGRYPYQVLLMREKGEFYCGGTLIAPDIVLTAAHCAVPARVEVGRHARNDNNDDFESHEILFSYRHPRYGKKSFEFDMQLLKLSKPSHNKPIRLNGNENLPNVIQGADQSLVTVMGFGKTKYGGSSANTLQEVDLNVISNEVCDQSRDSNSKRRDYQNGYEGKIFNDMLCLGDLNNSGKDSCAGDSGGPAILRGNTVEEDVQVGIVSWAFGCALSNFPGVYSRISHEFVWLRSSVCTMSDQPLKNFDCDSYTGALSLNVDRGPMVDITIKIEFALYPDRISWALTDATTLETLIYQPSSEYASLSSGSNYEQVVSLPAGSNVSYSIWSIGNNGLNTFSAVYTDYNNTEIVIMAGRGGGDADQDSATSAPHVLPSLPTNPPTGAPTKKPVDGPAESPIETQNPDLTPIATNTPTGALTRKTPIEIPTTPDPTHIVTTTPTGTPTRKPTNNPTKSPIETPTSDPTSTPSNTPTGTPTRKPTNDPTKSPTKPPTPYPTSIPSKLPTNDPTKVPTEIPTYVPSKRPTRTPTDNPTKLPTAENPTDAPSLVQTINLTGRRQRERLTEGPVTNQIAAPYLSPSNRPSSNPSASSLEPSQTKSEVLSVRPSTFPTGAPSIGPSVNPSRPFIPILPSSYPSRIQSDSPSFEPTSGATSDPVSISIPPSSLSSPPPPPPASFSNSPSIPTTSSSLIPTSSVPTAVTSTSTEDEVKFISNGTASPSGYVSPEKSSSSSISEISSSSSATVQNTPCYGRLILAITLSLTIIMTATSMMIT